MTFTLAGIYVNLAHKYKNMHFTLLEWSKTNTYVTYKQANNNAEPATYSFGPRSDENSQW